MTNEQEKAKELAKLLTAFADRKQLQFLNDNGYWCDYAATIKDIAEEFFTIEGIQIRIKPETKRIALNQQDLIDRELSGKTMRLSNGDFIWSWDDKHVRIINAYIAYDYLMETSSTFLDGSPCYKEVECE